MIIIAQPGQGGVFAVQAGQCILEFKVIGIGDKTRAGFDELRQRQIGDRSLTEWIGEFKEVADKSGQFKGMGDIRTTA